MSFSFIELLICAIPIATVILLITILKKKRPVDTNAVISDNLADSEKNIQPANDSNEQKINDETSQIQGPEASTQDTKNPLATTSLVLGILAIVFHILFGAVWSNFIGPFAIITGAISISRTKEQDNKRKSTAIIGIVLGILPLAITMLSIMLILLIHP